MKTSSMSWPRRLSTTCGVGLRAEDRPGLMGECSGVASRMGIPPLGLLGAATPRHSERWRVDSRPEQDHTNWSLQRSCARWANRTC